MGLGLKLSMRAIDKGWNELRKVAKNLREGGSYVKAGVMGDSSKNERPGDGISNVELALVHEFGAPSAGIPARPFVRSSFDANRAGYIAMLRQMVEQVYALKASIPRSLGILGAKMAADMKRRIREGIPPPNAPEVYRRKLAKGNGRGEPKPLIDTGRLLNSITWQVVVQGSEQSDGTPSDALEKHGGTEE